MKITLVKKILADGSPCRKCGDVLEKLEKSGHIEKIDTIVVADERDENSEGLQLAKQYSVDRAPFFIVDKEDGSAPKIYTVYMKFVKEVMNQKTTETDVAKDIMDSNPDLDFL